MREVYERRNRIDSVTQVFAFGNSIVAGFGASDATRDVMTRLAQMLKARENNRARNGSVLWWNNDLARQEYGVMATVRQTHRRPIRASSVIATTDPAIGAGSVTLTTAVSRDNGLSPAFAVNDLVHVGTGDTGATGGEIMTVTAVATPIITVQSNENNLLQSGSAVGLLRDHAIGDPVYVVPSGYQAANTLFLLCEVHNALGRRMPDATHKTWYQDALRECITRLRAAETYEVNHSANTFAGSWGASAGATASSSGQGVQGVKAPGATNDTWTFHVPNNFEGGTAFMSFTTNLTAAATVSWTIDGVASGSSTIPARTTVPAAKFQSFVKRFTGLAAGRHKIVMTVTALGTGNFYADYSGIEATEHPVIVIFYGFRFHKYDIYSSAHAYGHIRPTLVGTPSAGATTIVVTQAPIAGSRQLSTSIPATGETLTIDPRGSNKDTVTVTGAPSANGGNWNVPVTALGKSHSNSELVHIGIQDADLPTVNTWIDEVVAEFSDRYVITHDLDGVFNDPTTGLPNPQLFSQYDGAHLNDDGAAVAAEDLYRRLAHERRFTSRTIARMSQPTAPLPTIVTFLATGVALAWTLPSALQEFSNSAAYRAQVDLSKAMEARIGVSQSVAATAGARLRVQYSLNGGTDWYYLTRKTVAATDQTATDWAEPTLAADITPTEIDAGTGTGVKFSNWGFIYPEAQADVLLRLVGIGGGAGASTWLRVWLEVR